MKKVTMTKKGFTTKVLIQTDDRRYVMVEEGIEHRLDGADALNALYKDYLAKGYTVKPEKEVKEEKAAAAPKEPKAKKQYPDGFVWDKQQYWRIARSKGYTRVIGSDRYGRAKEVVLKKYRDTIYQLMADENNEKK